MDILTNWFLLMAVFAVALASPGPDLVMAIRNSLSHGRNAGIWTAVGFGLGVAVHVTYISLGFAALIASSIMLFTLLKIGGALYLFYVGFKALRSQGFTNHPRFRDMHREGSISPLKAIRQGFVTNVLNPKATLFFMAVLSQFITPNAPLWVYGFYGATCMLMTMGWFSIVALFLTVPAIRARFMAISKWVDRTCGAVFIALGVKLALTKATP
ncbi:MAG: LysE family translocator [Pseudobdellovibrionaceae bacterium]